MNRLKIIVLIAYIVGIGFAGSGIYQSITRTYYFSNQGLSIPNTECICFGLIISSLIIGMTWIVVSMKQDK